MKEELPVPSMRVTRAKALEEITAPATMARVPEALAKVPEAISESEGVTAEPEAPAVLRRQRLASRARSTTTATRRRRA